MEDNEIAKFRFIDKITNELLREEEMSFFDARLTALNNDCLMEIDEN